MMDKRAYVEPMTRLQVLMIITVGLLGVLIGCGGAEDHVRAPTATMASEPTLMAVVKADVELPPAPPETTPGDPGDVITTFWDWYLGYEGDRLAGNEQVAEAIDPMRDSFGFTE